MPYQRFVTFHRGRYGKSSHVYRRAKSFQLPTVRIADVPKREPVSWLDPTEQGISKA
jgi:hypothetical protein